MFASKRNSTPNNSPDGPSNNPSNSGEKPARWFDGALKWVTALTAIISLFFAMQKVTQTIADNTARSQQIGELLRVAGMQQQAMDFSRAWDSLAKAAQTADSGDALAKIFDPREDDIAKIHSQREDLAMAWLANIRVPEGKSFSDIVDKLVPVLERGTGTALPQRKADLLAHIGWSYFLRNRDGHHSFDPSQQYVQAIALDADNPYANAYWGHWLLWQNDDDEEANKHFAAALRSGRDRDRVRDLQLIAYYNEGEAGRLRFLQTAVDMTNGGETIPQNYHNAIQAIFENACSTYGKDLLQLLKTNIAGADLIKVYAHTQTSADAESDDRAECLARLK